MSSSFDILFYKGTIGEYSCSDDQQPADDTEQGVCEGSTGLSIGDKSW